MVTLPAGLPPFPPITESSTRLIPIRPHTKQVTFVDFPPPPCLGGLRVYLFDPALLVYVVSGFPPLEGYFTFSSVPWFGLWSDAVCIHAVCIHASTRKFPHL